MRLDKYLMTTGMLESRTKAQFHLSAGAVTVNGEVVTKNSYQLNPEDVVEIINDPCPYVSRGGLKLAKAIKEFHLDLRERVIIDLGASTGGFTDCALQNGAAKVYAVDVGVDQLATALRSDHRVISWEGRNLRTLRRDDFQEDIDFILCDVSFISADHVYPIIKRILKPDGQAVVLIKPQFEAGIKGAKKGVVRQKKQHLAIIKRALQSAANAGLFLVALSFSPYKGDAGNIEFLALLTPEIAKSRPNFDVQQVIDRAHESL